LVTIIKIALSQVLSGIRIDANTKAELQVGFFEEIILKKEGKRFS